MRAKLIDISKYQLWLLIKGILDGIIIRASYGMMKDKLFDTLTEAAQPILVRGAYHYFSSNIPWKTQADLFLKHVKDKGFHFYMLDFERAFNNKSQGFALGASKWIAYVAEQTDKKVGLYTNPATYREWLLPYGNWMVKWPLWVAQWPFFPRPDIGSPKMTGMRRSDWVLWQYSGDGNHKGEFYGVGSRDVDEDVFNGTAEELRAWAGVVIPEPPFPPPVPPPPDPPPPLPPPPIPPKSWLEQLVDFILSWLRSFRE